MGWVDFLRSDLRNANFFKAKMPGSNFTGALLDNANFVESVLIEATFRDAVLPGANFEAADLGRANLREAYLVNCNFRNAILTETDFTEAVFQNTDFTGATIGNTTFGGNDLSDVLGLEHVVHRGPSDIGVRTIYRSNGEVPEQFLRGCGLPDGFVMYAKSLVGAALEFYSCFISYSSRDQAFADRLYADLQSKGVRCWFAPHHAKAGKKLHEQIDDAIRLHDKLLLILSEDSMNSEWVRTEISKARQREKRDRRRVLFPISLVAFNLIRDWECFDADTGKDSAREIREYFVPDFSDWKNHDSYQQEFQKLIRDLKAES